MSRGPDKIVTTLGDVFAREAMRVGLRREPSIGWLAPLQLNIERAGTRPSAADPRFQRVETRLSPHPAWPAPREVSAPVAAVVVEPQRPAARAGTPVRAHTSQPRPFPARQPLGDVSATTQYPASAMGSGVARPADDRLRIGTAGLINPAATKGQRAVPLHRSESPFEHPTYPHPLEARAASLNASHTRAAPAAQQRPALHAVKDGMTADGARHEDAPALTNARDEEALLPANARAVLRDIVGSDAARIHRNGFSDAVAREHHADAVTIGQDVFFRTDTFWPHEPQGLALLAHEATHVAEALRPGAAWRRATDGGVQAEETLALRRERDVLRAHRPAAAPTARAAGGSHRPAATRAAAAAPQMRPMAAEPDRALPPANAAPEVSTRDLDELRRTLFRELMAKIRVEFERGA